jgi:hypothetical protein
VHKESSPQSSCDSVGCVVRINFCINHKPFSARIRHVWGKLLLPLLQMSKLTSCPVLQFKSGLVENWVTRIMHHLSLVVLLQACKDLKWLMPRCPSLGNNSGRTAQSIPGRRPHVQVRRSIGACQSKTCSTQHQSAAVLGTRRVPDGTMSGVATLPSLAESNLHHLDWTDVLPRAHHAVKWFRQRSGSSLATEGFCHNFFGASVPAPPAPGPSPTISLLLHSHLLSAGHRQHHG